MPANETEASVAAAAVSFVMVMVVEFGSIGSIGRPLVVHCDIIDQGLHERRRLLGCRRRSRVGSIHYYTFRRRFFRGIVDNLHFFFGLANQ